MCTMLSESSEGAGWKRYAQCTARGGAARECAVPGPAECAYLQARKWGIFELGDKQILRGCYVGPLPGAEIPCFQAHGLNLYKRHSTSVPDPPRAKPAHAKYVYAQARKPPFSDLTVYILYANICTNTVQCRSKCRNLQFRPATRRGNTPIPYPAVDLPCTNTVQDPLCTMCLCPSAKTPFFLPAHKQISPPNNTPHNTLHPCIT